MTKQTSELAGVRIVPDDTAPEVMAQAIVVISESMKKLLATPLKTDTIITLIQSDCKLPRKTILAVINSLRDLEFNHIKPKKVQA